MKTLQIRESSWHYRLMSALCLESRYSDNICGYLRGLLLLTPLIFFAGTAFTLLVLTGLIGGVIGLGDFLGWAAACAATLSWLEVPHSGLWIIGASIMVLVGLFGFYKAVEWFFNLAPPEMPEIVAASWDSVHNRICCRVKRIT